MPNAFSRPSPTRCGARLRPAAADRPADGPRYVLTSPELVAPLARLLRRSRQLAQLPAAIGRRLRLGIRRRLDLDRARS